MVRFTEPHIYTPVDDSLVLWISGRGRGVGSKVFDLSKKGNHGTIYGATWKNTPIGHSVLSFDGVDDYISIPNNESLDITDEITIEAWAKMKEVEGGERHKIIVGKFDSDYDPYALIYDNVDHFVGFKLSADLVSIVSYSYTPDDKWHHLAGTYDGKKVRFYFDGELKYTESNSGSIKIREYPVTIGGWTSQTRFINCLIDEARIYNRALSAGEIQQRYQNTKHLYGY